MKITNATRNHAEYISSLLASHFSKANQFFEYPKYKDSYEIMLKHVSKRIELEEGGFVYFVAEDEMGSSVGFINVLINEDRVGSILVTIADTKDIAKELILKAISYLEEQGINNIQGEIFEFESDLKEIYSEIGIKNELLNFKLSI
ncbi:hypothetical protein KKA50_00350 [Patescibacteria group bacterium]|nr:hypothetical protein [Patescibacteria group bacterium]